MTRLPSTERKTEHTRLSLAVKLVIARSSQRVSERSFLARLRSSSTSSRFSTARTRTTLPRVHSSDADSMSRRRLMLCQLLQTKRYATKYKTLES